MKKGIQVGFAFMIIAFLGYGATTMININQVNGLTTALAGKSATTGDPAIATVGTITSGTWQGTPVTVTYGGTGNASATAYSVLCGGTTTTGAFQSVSGLGSSGQVLTSNGAAALPTWQTATSSGTVTSFSAGTLSPLFTTSVATATSTPALTFALSNAAAHTFMGNNTGSTGAPSYAAIGEADVTNLTSDLALKLTITKFITRETPSGSVNGSNVTFTLTNTPVSSSEMVFLNGVLQDPGAGNDYTISTTTITYLTAPITGDRIRVTYISQ